MFLLSNNIFTSSLGCIEPKTMQGPHLFLSSPSSIKLSFHLLLLVCFIQVPFNNAQQAPVSSLQPPTFIKDMNGISIRENTPPGQIIYSLSARLDPESPPLSRIHYNIYGTRLFEVDKLTGNVRVGQSIDREQTSDSVTFHVSATTVLPQQIPRIQQQQSSLQTPSVIVGPATNISITVYILDENDTPPKIVHIKAGEQEYYSNQLNRYSGRSPIVRLNIEENAPIESVIVDLIEAQDSDVASSNPLRSICLNCANEFELRSTTDKLLNDRLNLSIVLVEPLIHIPRNNIRQLNLIVTDGKFNTSVLIEITIDNVQNKPPQFIGSTTFLVKENSPIDMTVVTLQAIDGDAIAIDDIASSLMKGGNKLGGGREVVYDLIAADERSLFKLHPLTGQLQVANKIDRESNLGFGDVLILRARARELTRTTDSFVRLDESYETILDKITPFIDSSIQAAAEVDLRIIIQDVNDNEPHWLNGSEMASLNKDQSMSWHQNLPNDRDPGRHYKFYIKENSQAGSPITTQNEMFVYDLDNGENANFNISLRDPFNLFDVEPKEVSGFAMVTLKLISSESAFNEQQKMLDYENQNQRSFIIQLIATEIDTNEKQSSIAQIQINVLDVNDNAPEFKEQAYYANIREDSRAGKSIIMVQAQDRDEVSTRITYSLHGITSNLFDIDPRVGLITVARCEQLDLDQPRPICIDYERQKTHHLMVEASDGELSSMVPLTIFIDDASDNAPVFKLPVLDVVIEEGSTKLDPPIKIEATDIDQSSVLSYSIVEGNFEGLFTINNATGEIQLTRPIRISHDDYASSDHVGLRQQPLNKMTLIVQASDGVASANGTIRIDVLDANDNSPSFIRPQYTAELSELASPGQYVVKVSAIDSDRGNNARVSYKIQRGSFGLFEIDESSGVISVSKLATAAFDASKRSNYTIEVIAQDHGLVSRSSSVLVHIHILDTIKRAPEFNPKIQRISITENLPNNTIIYRMRISESNNQDIASKLLFEPGPIEALDKNGHQVLESDRLLTMFSVSQDTGEVVVNSALDYDFVAYVNLTIFVGLIPSSLDTIGPNETYSAPTPEEFSPRSVGYLIINVVDYNDNAPIFGPPWTPQATELNYQMLEELPVGSILTHLNAFDDDSKISHFKIDPPNEYFELTSPQSGIIVNKRQIDYDALMRQTFRLPSQAYRSLTPVTTTTTTTTTTTSSALSTAATTNTNNIIQFNVHVFDSGTPQLSSKAIVNVEILPINDWDCKFDQPVYDIRVKENTRPEVVLLQVRAQDLDYGEQHSVVRYQLAGENSEMFNVDPRTGIINVSQKGSLELDRERLSRASFSMIVIAKDEQTTAASISGKEGKTNHQRSSQRTCSASIRVVVEDINDNPPLFSQQIYEVTAYDTDVVNVPLIDLLVRDNDSLGNQGTRASNTFKIISGNVNDAFTINSAGIIYSTKHMNETFTPNQLIELRVQVQQRATNLPSGPLLSFTDECIVRINYIKFNRYGPEWRQDQKSQQPIVVEENSKVGTLISQLKCFDRDYDTKFGVSFVDNRQDISQAIGNVKQRSISPMRYWIKENGSSVSETREFKLDPVTGNLTTRRELDRETMDVYQLIVVCEDNGKPQSLESITTIYIHVSDIDDNQPEFVVPQINRMISSSVAESIKPLPKISFTVEEHQSKGLPIGELRAIDRDLESSIPISYCLIDGNESQEFLLDRITGILYTNKTLDREKQSSYDLLVKAINDATTCEDHIIRPSSNLSQHHPLASSNNSSLLMIKLEVLDINDNAPVFKRPIYRAGVNHKTLMNTLIAQVAAYDPDADLNGSLSYKISEIWMYKTAIPQNQAATLSRSKYDVEISDPIPLSKPIKLVQFPFRIDKEGNIYTQQLLTQYQLMSMFTLKIETNEMAEPWRSASTNLEIYIYEVSNQLKIRINLHPRLVEQHGPEIETLLSNVTKYTAIITRSKSYYGASNNGGKFAASPPSDRSSSVNANRQLKDGLDNSYESSMMNGQSENEPTSTNIYLIFVDNNRIVNPSLVMEKFDLTSAQLFTPQSLFQSTSAKPTNQLDSRSTQTQDLQLSEVSSLIDKIALASAVQSAEFQLAGTGSMLASIDWLENPAILIVISTAVLAFVGFIICLFGCCCTSRIKDHIVKVAMDKLVRQQAMQAKINEQVLAATNQANVISQQNPNGFNHDYLLQQGGFISAFDATKGCISNNNENMSILHRAMQDSHGEFIDPNYTTLNWQANIGAHYYDTSELDEAGEIGTDHHNAVGVNMKQQFDESRASLSLGDEYEDEDGDGDLSNNQHTAKVIPSKLMTPNGTGNITNNQRQRQQVPLKID